MSEFGKMLDHLIRATGSNPYRWAVANRGSVPSASHVGNLIRGKRPPSDADAAKLADALHLNGDTRRRFFRLAWIAHLSDEAQDDLEALVRDFEILRQRVHRLERGE